MAEIVFQYGKKTETYFEWKRQELEKKAEDWEGDTRKRRGRSLTGRTGGTGSWRK